MYSSDDPANNITRQRETLPASISRRQAKQQVRCDTIQVKEISLTSPMQAHRTNPIRKKRE
jgi:hypothetical protein